VRLTDFQRTTEVAPVISGAVLAILGLTAVVWAVVRVVRYIRADSETRVSIRQAGRIRRRWKRLAPMVGLSVTDKMPTTLASLTAKEGETPKPRVLVPTIKVEPDRYGVIVRAACLPKVSLEEFQRAAPYLADAWGCTRVSVLPDRPGELIIRGVRTDPLLTKTVHVPTGKAPDDLTVWRLGVDEYAQPVNVSLHDVAGVTAAGLPGKGKSSLTNKFICDTAPSAAIQYAVADGKASSISEGDYADLADRLFAFVGDDLAAANVLFKRLVKLRRDRSAVMLSVLKTKNMWSVGPTPSWPLTVLIVDEAHTFFREHKGNDPATKKLAALAAENARLVEDLVKKGRSFGILVILATQKATGDALPTFIRDVCEIGLSFAQKTADAAVAALGDDIRNWPDASPVNLQDPAYVGVAVMSVMGRPGFTRVRTPYVDESHAARIAADSAHLTRDPAALLREFAPLSLRKDLDTDDTAAEAA